MIGIGQFFNKFLKINQNSDLLKSKILEALNTSAGLNLTAKNFTLKEGVIFLSCSGAVRTEILLRKEKIIDQLSSFGIKIRDIK